MANISSEILKWVSTLKYWQQATFAKILTGEPFKEETYDSLLIYLLEDAKLKEPAQERPKLDFHHEAALTSAGLEKVALTKISNLQGVNRLVPDQSITFGRALTAIYGGNGSGKSGYARVFGCAGFTRGDRQVLPDITQAGRGKDAPSADIEICCGEESMTIPYCVNSQCPELSSFHVFDATSVQVHLAQPNGFSFSPAGLDSLTRLVEETDKVRERLKTLVQQCEQPHSFRPLFQDGETPVTDYIEKLGPASDLEQLEKFASLSQEEVDSVQLIDEKIAKLKTKNVSKQISELEQTKKDLEGLVLKLKTIEGRIDDESVRQIEKEITTYQDADEACNKLSIDQFRSDHFTQIGTQTWRVFLEAAKKLAEAEGTPEKPYPQAGDQCLLCHQSLTEPAQALLHLLWDYLKGEAQAKLDRSKALLNKARVGISSLDLDFFEEKSVFFRQLKEHDPALQKNLSNLIETYRQRRQNILAAIDNRLSQPLVPVPHSLISAIDTIVQRLETRLEILRAQDREKEIAELQQQLLLLKHRMTLGQNLHEIKKYLQNRRWAQKADSAGGSSRKITLKHDELFRELVAKGYGEKFKENLGLLGRPINVTLETVPRKGQTFRQVVIQSQYIDAGKSACTPDKILSEGEKRAVALADFLTEITLSDPCNGIILDDPVTSLDVEWRQTIASLLANEAKNRQVIIFTHDLPFLYYLKMNAEQGRIEFINHWIKRGDEDDRPGYVYLNNSPALERDYRSVEKAQKMFEKASSLPAQEQEALLKQGFGAVRTCYEAFVIFELFGEVVQRFDERISIGRLKDLVWDEVLIKEVIDRYESLSRYIEGHLHSDRLGPIKPTPKLLEDEIKAFAAIRDGLKALKKRKR